MIVTVQRNIEGIMPRSEQIPGETTGRRARAVR
jgi:hypothetical protein